MKTSTLKHTPGPWRQDRQFPSRVVAGAVTNIKDGVAVRSICKVEGEILPDWKANLQLIAAAPDLLAALQGLLSETGFRKMNVKKDFHLMVHREAAHRAILKATAEGK